MGSWRPAALPPPAPVWEEVLQGQLPQENPNHGRKPRGQSTAGPPPGSWLCCAASPGPCASPRALHPSGRGGDSAAQPSLRPSDGLQPRWRMCPGPAHPQELQSQAPLGISTLTFHTLTDSNRLNENAQTPPLLYPLLSGHPWNPGKFQVLFTSLLS